MERSPNKAIAILIVNMLRTEYDSAFTAHRTQSAKITAYCEHYYMEGLCHEFFCQVYITETIPYCNVYGHRQPVISS